MAAGENRVRPGCTRIWVYLCTGILVYWCASVTVYQCIGVPVYLWTRALVYQTVWCTRVLVSRGIGVPVYRYTSVLVYMCTSAPVYRCTVYLCTGEPVYQSTLVHVYYHNDVPVRKRRVRNAGPQSGTSTPHQSGTPSQERDGVESGTPVWPVGNARGSSRERPGGQSGTWPEQPS